MTRPLVGLLLACALAVSACSDDGSSGDAGPDGSSSGTSGASQAAETPYLPVPDEVELTAQGSELALGDTATVAYELNQQDQVATVEYTVTRIDKASFKLFEGWKLRDDVLATTPYFVHVEVTNVGDTDLGGDRISPPMYAVDGTNKLVEASSFQSVFKPCDGLVYPKKFANGASTKACLVFLAPDKGEVTAVSVRPTEAFNPIVWTGDITRPEPTDGPTKKSDDKKKDKQN